MYIFWLETKFVLTVYRNYSEACTDVILSQHYFIHNIITDLVNCNVGIRTDDWLLRHQNRWLITEAPKTDDWLLRWPLLVYGGTEGSKEQIANSNGVDRCFKRMVIWQSFLALFNCWWIHPWSDVDIDARIF